MQKGGAQLVKFANPLAVTRVVTRSDSLRDCNKLDSCLGGVLSSWHAVDLHNTPFDLRTNQNEVVHLAITYNPPDLPTIWCVSGQDDGSLPPSVQRSPRKCQTTASSLQSASLSTQTSRLLRVPGLSWL